MKEVKTISYKGYKIEVLNKTCAVVVCKSAKCKGKYIPFFDEEGCKGCIDRLKNREVKESEYALIGETFREFEIKVGE